MAASLDPGPQKAGDKSQELYQKIYGRIQESLVSYVTEVHFNRKMSSFEVLSILLCHEQRARLFGKPAVVHG
jgi:hypothetical protein